MWYDNFVSFGFASCVSLFNGIFFVVTLLMIKRELVLGAVNFNSGIQSSMLLEPIVNRMFWRACFCIFLETALLLTPWPLLPQSRLVFGESYFVPEFE